MHKCWKEDLKLSIFSAIFYKGGWAGLRVCLPGARMATLTCQHTLHEWCRAFRVTSLEASIWLLASSRLPPKHLKNCGSFASDLHRRPDSHSPGVSTQGTLYTKGKQVATYRRW